MILCNLILTNFKFIKYISFVNSFYNFNNKNISLKKITQTDIIDLGSAWRNGVNSHPRQIKEIYDLNLCANAVAVARPKSIKEEL